jgi:hypothetical protein
MELKVELVEQQETRKERKLFTLLKVESKAEHSISAPIYLVMMKKY